MPEGFNHYAELIEINWTVIIQLINTLIMFLILRHFLFNPVRNLMLSRQAKIDNAFADAEMKKVNADALHAEYESKMENLTTESREIVKAAKLKADTQAADIIEEARQKAANILKKAEDEIAREREKAVSELRDQISGIAIFAAEKILERELTEKAQNDMIDKLIEEAGKSQWHS